MNNFNPYFNSINMTRSVSPFATAGSSFLTGATQAARNGRVFSRLGSSKITLSGILNGAQKTIGTVNQIVPLYNQVKPMFQNSKILLNIARGLKANENNNSKKFFGSKRKNKIIYEQNSTNINQEITKEKKVEHKNENTPSKPFFA